MSANTKNGAARPADPPGGLDAIWPAGPEAEERIAESAAELLNGFWSGYARALRDYHRTLSPDAWRLLKRAHAAWTAAWQADNPASSEREEADAPEAA